MVVRLLHTADWQIGMTRRFLEPEAQARFTAARADAVRRLGGVARDQGCDLVVVCGDVFESNHLTPQTVRRALDALRAVPVPVYLLPGNHDPLDAASIYRSELFRTEVPGHVHVLDRPGIHEVAPGLELVAAPWESKHPGRDLLADALAHVPEGPAPDGLVRVVVGHGAVDELDPDRRSDSSIRTAPLVTALQEGRVHYVALGDRHSRTAVAGRPDIWYSGAPEPTRETEVAPGDVLVVDLDPAHGSPPRVTPHRVATWTFRVLERRVDGDADLEVLEQELHDLPDKDRTVVHLALAGTLTVPQLARLDGLRERHRDQLGALVERDHHQDVVVVGEGDETWAGLAVGGFVAAAAAEIQVVAGSGVATGAAAPGATGADGTTPSAFVAGRPDDGESARDALALLYRLTGGAA
ncbi:metallophosphoesterase family protein [Ornithinimicrobium sp. W1665]|uniref:metallophosphoesterase family protein n=1 Tax=Ornithinimicrobium sp. W1665 TaxID=3416666 RepID=UPI003CF7A6EC